MTHEESLAELNRTVAVLASSFEGFRETLDQVIERLDIANGRTRKNEDAIKDLHAQLEQDRAVEKALAERDLHQESRDRQAERASYDDARASETAKTHALWFQLFKTRAFWVSVTVLGGILIVALAVTLSLGPAVMQGLQILQAAKAVVKP